uniref:Uncharacterized protein n=1 Tax=Physcomitrium patens TaxID=3218 RepID=A0A2K1IIG1_PHYPA|nr:hypothetical protein PHYPA_027755 [Physcomitrium patens]
MVQLGYYTSSAPRGKSHVLELHRRLLTPREDSAYDVASINNVLSSDPDSAFSPYQSSATGRRELLVTMSLWKSEIKCCNDVNLNDQSEHAPHDELAASYLEVC